MLRDLVAEDYQGPAGERGASGFRAPSRLRGAFPDIRFTLEDLIAEGEGHRPMELAGDP